MARSTSKKKTSKSPPIRTSTTPTTSSTTPVAVAASDTPNLTRALAPTPSSTLLQETSTPVQASSEKVPKARKTRPDVSKDPKTIKIKLPSQAPVRNSLGTTTPLPATDTNNAALLARIAKQEGK